jgi:hypothetical protein
MPASPRPEEPAQQNLRVSTCARKVFSWGKKLFRNSETPALIIRMRGANPGCVIGRKNSGEKTAYQHRFGNATHREHVGAST